MSNCALLYSPANMPGCAKKLVVRSSSLMMTISPLPPGLCSLIFVSVGWLFILVLGSSSWTLVLPLLPPAAKSQCRALSIRI